MERIRSGARPRPLVEKRYGKTVRLYVSESGWTSAATCNSDMSIVCLPASAPERGDLVIVAGQDQPHLMGKLLFKTRPLPLGLPHYTILAYLVDGDKQEIERGSFPGATNSGEP